MNSYEQFKNYMQAGYGDDGIDGINDLKKISIGKYIEGGMTGEDVHLAGHVGNETWQNWADQYADELELELTENVYS
jgi:hypothetical protein